MKRLYDANFAIAFISQTLFVTAHTSMTHYTRWISYLGGDERDVGSILGVGMIVGLLARPWMGQCIDRVGDRTTMTVGAVIYVLALVANVELHGIGLGVYVLRAVALMAAALFFASSLTYITRVAPPERRTEAIGSLGAGGFAGILIGPNLGDFFMSGAVRDRDDFVWLFGAAGVFALLATALIACLKPTPPREPAPPFHPAEFFHHVRRYWPGRVLVVDLVFGLCMTVPFAFLPRFADLEQLGRLGPFFLVYAGWGLFVRLGLSGLPEQLGRRNVLLLGLAFFCVGMVSFLWVDGAHPLRLLLPALLCGSGHALTFHTMVSLTMESFPPRWHGTGSVLALMLLDLGQIGGAPVLGLIAYYAGFNWLFLSVGLGVLLAGAYFAMGPERSAIDVTETISTIVDEAPTAPAPDDFASV